MLACCTSKWPLNYPCWCVLHWIWQKLIMMIGPCFNVLNTLPAPSDSFSSTKIHQQLRKPFHTFWIYRNFQHANGCDIWRPRNGLHINHTLYPAIRSNFNKSWLIQVQTNLSIVNIVMRPYKCKIVLRRNCPYELCRMQKLRVGVNWNSKYANKLGKHCNVKCKFCATHNSRYNQVGYWKYYAGLKLAFMEICAVNMK